MGGILKLLGGPVSDLVGSIGKVIDNVSTTDAERLEAQRKLIEIERNFQIKMMEIDTEYAKAQAGVIETEMKSESWMARNWRPILMMVFTYIVLHRFVLAPVFSFPQVEIPTDLWELLKLGMGGYIIGRSAEKIAPSVVEVFRKEK